jgi:hypothetical protein
MQGQRDPTSRRVTSASAHRRACLALTTVGAACLGMHVTCTQAAPPSVVIDVGDCVDLKSPGERLDCYERHVEAAKQNSRATPAATPQPEAVANAPTPQPSAVANAPTPPPAALAATAVVGAAAATAPNAAAPQAAPAAPAPTATPAAPAPAVASAASTSAPGSSTDTAGFSKPAPHDAPPPPEIVATVAELHETVPNAWLITLDNGQIWRQSIPQRFALKPGNHVTLRGTNWGSAFRLTAEELHGFIQVERVR